MGSGAAREAPRAVSGRLFRSFGSWHYLRSLSAVEAICVGGVAVCLLLQLHLIFRQEVNWDEFFFLSFIHDYLRGDLGKALQTFHVHMFGWLPSISSNEIRQIEAGRIVMLLFEAGTTLLVFLTARRLCSREAAAVAALAYLSFGYVLAHGASFRADPIAAFFLMAALALVARSRLGNFSLLVIAASLALAALITVKAVFWAPAIVGLVLYRLWEVNWNQRLLARLLATAFTAIAAFALLYLSHLSTLAEASHGRSEAMMSSALSKTILEAPIFPRLETILRGLILSPIHHVLLILGIVSISSPAGWRRGVLPKFIALAGLALPLLTFVFYRNAFPYYYAFILPPCLILLALAAERLERQRLLLAVLAGLMTLSAAFHYVRALQFDRVAQEETVAAIHQIFPEPIPYIDRSSMISSYPKRGFFMSSWGMQDYRDRGTPVFEQILAEDRPRFVLANAAPLERALQGTAPAPDEQQLLPKDAATLRKNFVHHWGVIWVAGKRIAVDQQPQEFKISVPGVYTVEAGQAVILDGAMLAPGATVRLRQGRHFVSAGNQTELTLRWGEHLFRPEHDPTPSPIFWGF